MSMSMGGGGPWQTYRSFTRDRSVADQTITTGTVSRIFGFARPYRREIIWFLVTLVFTSLLVVAQPLLFRRLVDEGIDAGNATVVTVSAVLVLVLAIVEAGIGLVGRWFSARIGEGLIFDLRTEVFSHVESQPLAFFTRTQTGALISRLNSDVIGAQQAFTSTLGGVVGNVITLTVILVAMFALSWPITVISLILLPLFLIPARWMGRRLQAQTREQMQLNADMSSMMTERFNVSGALLVKLFGRPDEESAAFAGKASRVRDIGVEIAMSNRYFFTALTLVASRGHSHRLRRGRQPGHPGHPDDRDAAGHHRAAGPAVRPADRPEQCPRRRDDRAGVLRAGLRGARPRAARLRGP